MSVEEVLVVDERVGVAELHDLVVRLGGGQQAEARARVEEQRRPQHLWTFGGCCVSQCKYMYKETCGKCYLVTL